MTYVFYQNDITERGIALLYFHQTQFRIHGYLRGKVIKTSQ